LAAEQVEREVHLVVEQEVEVQLLQLVEPMEDHLAERVELVHHRVPAVELEIHLEVEVHQLVLQMEQADY
jgi:hypothetical protein